MSFALRSYRALAATVGLGLLAACNLKLSVAPVGPTTPSPSASPTQSAPPPQPPRPTTSAGTTAAPTVAPASSTPSPNGPPSVAPSPFIGPSVAPTATPVDPNGTPLATPTPVPGQGPDLPGEVIEILQLPLKSPYNVAVDPDGNLWITTPNEQNALHKLGPDGKLLASYAGQGGVDVGIDAQGRVWTASTSTRVIDRATGEVLASYPVWSSHLAFDAAGATWTISYSKEELNQFGPDGVVANTFSLAPRDWNGGMAFDPEGNVWITGRKVSSPASIQEILKVAPTGEILARFPEPALAIAFGPDKRAHLVFSNAVKTLDLDGKLVGNFVLGPGYPHFQDIAPDGKGNWFLLDNSSSRLYRVKL